MDVKKPLSKLGAATAPTDNRDSKPVMLLGIGGDCATARCDGASGQRDGWRRLQRGNNFPTMRAMGKVHTSDGWLIRVQGNEHPPVHVHVLHPNGKALIDVDGHVTNDGVPAKVIKQALAWVRDHGDVIAAEWAHMNNPTKR